MTYTDRRRLLVWLARHLVVGAVALTAASKIALRRGALDRYELQRLGRNREELERKVAAGEYDVVVVGNSLLLRAVNEAAFRRTLRSSGYRAAKLTPGGSASAVWYLLFKHTVLKMNPKPKLVILGNVENELTWSTSHTSGRYVTHLKAYSGGAEPELTGILVRNFLNEREHTDAVLALLRHWWPAYYCKNSVRDFVTDRVTSSPSEWLRRFEKWHRLPSYEKVSAEVFGRPKPTPRTRSASPYRARSKMDYYNFREAMEGSFFAEIVKMCKQHEIGIGLVGLKRRPEWGEAAPGIQRDVTRYREQLKAYAVENEILFVDFTEDEYLDQDCFRRGNHLNKKGAAHVTPILAQSVIRYLDSHAGEGSRDNGGSLTP